MSEEKDNSTATKRAANLQAISKQSLDALSLASEALSEVPSEVIIKSRIKYGNRWSACKGILMEYSKETTIHGVRYIFEVHRPFYEKLYWFILLNVSIYFAISLIWATFIKWQDSPVILGFDETLVPVHKIPFPTVTICPEIKVNREDFDFTNVSIRISEEIKQYSNFKNRIELTSEELNNFASTLHICESDVQQRFASFLPQTIMPDVANTLVNMSVSKNETGIFCKWNGRFYFCNFIFNFVATDEGICYQFNGMRTKDIYRDERYVSFNDPMVVDFNNFFDDLEKLNNYTGTWSLEEGYVDQGYNSYPQRTVFASTRNAFFAALQGFEHNFDYSCRSFKQGYKIFLNSPESVPLTTGNYILVPHHDEVMVSVLPKYVVATPNLHAYSPQKRQCYFNDERYLRFFRAYSQSNCQTECLANYTVSKCGCAKFWMPKPFDVPVCGFQDIDCYSEAQNELNIIVQNQTRQKIVNSNVKIMCDCMPSCTSLEYDYEISRAFYNMPLLLNAMGEVYEHSDAVGSRLAVYFKEHQFTAIKRTVLFSVTTLIANCGGICGLFMGISGFSFIELIYFFTARVCANVYKRRKAKKELFNSESADVTHQS